MPQMSYRHFAGYAAIAVGIALIPILIWKLSDILLLGFGGIMVASLLRLIAEPLRRYVRLPVGLCLVLSGLIVFAAVASTIWLFEVRAAGQFKQTFERIMLAVKVLKVDLNKTVVGQYLLQQAERSDFSITAVAERFLSTGLSSLEALLLVFIVAIFVAAQPVFYEEGVVRMFPSDQRERLRTGFEIMGRGLRLWLIGQLIGMAVIGLLAGFACWLVGLHTPYALGFIAALFEFLPYIGPLLSAVPALLVALTQSADMVFWTAGAYLVIHQIEGNLLMPLVQRWVVAAPPALMLMGIAVSASLFGIYGLIFGAPIVIVALVAIKVFYVKDVLKDDVSLPKLAAEVLAGRN